jgi:hypothetical protein
VSVGRQPDWRRWLSLAIGEEDGFYGSRVKGPFATVRPRFGSSCSNPWNVLVELLVYARHGHALMGCKSPSGMLVVSTMWVAMAINR